MNIGKWIFVAFVLFTGFIATLVVVCVRQDISLVSKDYYQEELQYQTRIMQEMNTASLEAKPIMEKKAHQLEVKFAELNVAKGTLSLFCPANEKMDRLFNLPPNQSIALFDVTGLQAGMYRARLQWTMGEKEYYLEEIIYL